MEPISSRAIHSCDARAWRAWVCGVCGWCQDGASPLHESVYNSTMEMTQLLIDNGANVRALDQDGRQPVHWATDNPFGPRPLCMLIEKYGVDVDVVDDADMTPLMWAACHDQAPMVHALLDLKCDTIGTADVAVNLLWMPAFARRAFWLMEHHTGNK